jgi:hypothetical protein
LSPREIVAMSKYQPLSEHLSAAAADEWRPSFQELEQILGFPLPKAARTSRSWWANDADKSHSRAWAAHGWEVGDVDHAAERVVFRRGAASGIALAAAADLKPLGAKSAGAAPSKPARTAASASAADAAAQPPAMRDAAEAASARMHATRTLGAAAIVTAAAAVMAGLGAVIARGVGRKRRA